MTTEEKVNEISRILFEHLPYKKFSLSQSIRMKGRKRRRFNLDGHNVFEGEFWKFSFEVQGDDVTKVYDTFKLFNMEHKLEERVTDWGKETHYAFIKYGEFEDTSLENFMN